MLNLREKTAAAKEMCGAVEKTVLFDVELIMGRGVGDNRIGVGG